MSGDNMGEDNGVWRTIRGRRVFIREGQSLTEAMERSGKFDSGGQRGAKKTDGWKDRHAQRYYEEVRRRAPYSDAAKIARHVDGFSVQQIEDIRQHVFLKEQPRDGRMARFDADYEQAQVWQRLVEGKDIRPSDTVFLKHERMELTIMRQTGYNYEKAHEMANAKYNWQSEKER